MTVYRHVLTDGMFAYERMLKRLPPHPRHIAARPRRPISHSLWTRHQEKVNFSDKKCFNLDNLHGFKYYWNQLQNRPRILFGHRSGGCRDNDVGAVSMEGKVNFVFFRTHWIRTSYQYIERLFAAFDIWKPGHKKGKLLASRKLTSLYVLHGIARTGLGAWL